MYRLTMDTEKYYVRDKRYGVGFGRWNLNVCKKRKNKQREEPAVLNTINKIELVKSSMKCHLPLCWFITKMQCLSVLLENM